MFGEKKESPCKHLRDWKIIKNLALKWLFRFGNLVVCGLFVPHQFICPGCATLQILTSQKQWRRKIWGSLLGEDRSDHEVEIRLQPNLPTNA